jgi:hypothetical protein
MTIISSLLYSTTTGTQLVPCTNCCTMTESLLTRAFHATGTGTCKLGLNGRRKDVMVRSSSVSPEVIIVSTGYHKSIDKRFETGKGVSLITSSTHQLKRSLVVFSKDESVSEIPTA